MLTTFDYHLSARKVKDDHPKANLSEDLEDEEVHDLQPVSYDEAIPPSINVKLLIDIPEVDPPFEDSGCLRAISSWMTLMCVRKVSVIRIDSNSGARTTLQKWVGPSFSWIWDSEVVELQLHDRELEREATEDCGWITKRWRWLTEG